MRVSILPVLAQGLRRRRLPFPDVFASATPASPNPIGAAPRLSNPSGAEAEAEAGLRPMGALAISAGPSPSLPPAEARLVLEVAEGRFAGAQVHLHFQPGGVQGSLRKSGRRIRRCRW